MCICGTIVVASGHAAQRERSPDAVQQLGEDLIAHEERGAEPPVRLRFLVPPDDEAHLARIADTVKRSLALMNEWFGSLPEAELTVIHAPWDSGSDRGSLPGLLVAEHRMIQPAADMSLERALITALARRYWINTVDPDPSGRWSEEGVALYAAARAINELLDEGHAVTSRHFGGAWPHTIRSLELTRHPWDPRPIVRWFPEFEPAASARWRSRGAVQSDRARRAALGFHTLERRIGWPALQQALAAFVAQARRRPATPDDFAAILHEQRGIDPEPLLNEAFGVDAVFDYAIGSAASTPDPEDRTQFRTMVTVRRVGDAVAPSVSVLVRFDDGSEIRQRRRLVEQDVEIGYRSRARAVYAAVDPDLEWLIDANRFNNARHLRPSLPPTGARMLMQWVAWLQDLMLTYTALA